jgi:hypothetical protein
MAKEIPFFKFFVGEWANGDITAESYNTQGVFINICSIYWTKEGELTEKFIRKKIKDNKAINDLIESEIIKVVDGFIKISFLDEQLTECEDIRKRNSAAGKKSASKRALNKRSTTVQQPFNETSTKLQPLREDKDKEKIREDKEKIREDLKQNYKPEFDSIFSKIKTRFYQDWITEVYNDYKSFSPTCEKSIQEFIDGTMKYSILEFCKSCKYASIKFFNETAAINYWKQASKGYVSDIDVWRDKLKAMKKRSEEQLASLNS